MQVPTSHQRLPDEAPAVLTTESVHVNVGGSSSSTPGNQNLKNGQAHNMASPEATATTATATHNNKSTSPQKTTTTSHHQQQKSTSITIPVSEASMRTIELSTGRIREGFGKFAYSFHSKTNIF